jgi:hypothetical protein
VAEVNYSLVVSFLIVIAVAMVAPVIYDMHLAYKRKQQSGASSLSESTAAPAGMPGLYRTIMTFGIILILGAVIFYVLAALNTNIGSINSMGNNMNNNTATTILQVNRDLTQQLTTISTILGGAIASIIGFYFGNRAAESGAKAAQVGAEVAESAAKAATDRMTKAGGADTGVKAGGADTGVKAGGADTGVKAGGADTDTKIEDKSK